MTNPRAAAGTSALGHTRFEATSPEAGPGHRKTVPAFRRSAAEPAREPRSTWSARELPLDEEFAVSCLAARGNVAGVEVFLELDVGVFRWVLSPELVEQREQAHEF